ncbi:MAG: hypothetical protein HYS06_05975 [Methylocystis sp.]|nr:hypothetical protein [Methylocystis sp.]
MTTEPTIRDVMAAIQGIGSRLDKMETGLDKIETRLDKIGTRLDKMEARLDKVESRLEKIETRVGEIDAWRKTQPDLRLMLANSKVTLDKIVQIDSEIRILHSVIVDHASKNVTPGVIEAFHHDLSALQKAELENAGRLLRIEEILHLTTP